MRGIEKYKKELDALLEKYNNISTLLSYEEVLLDKKLMLSLSKQKRVLEPIVNLYEEYKKNRKILVELQANKSLFLKEDKSIFENEVSLLDKTLSNLEEKIRNTFLDLNGKIQSITVEIISNKDEQSQKLKGIILQSYLKYCENNAFEISTLNENVFKIKGINVQEHLKNEVGIHISNINLKKGECKVLIYNVRGEKFSFEEKDIEIIACRSSGAGGQHINTTDSAIKATHKKTGISAVCQDERSQFQNKEKAIERLREKVLVFYENENKIYIEKQKKEILKNINKNIINYDFLNEKIIKNQREISLKEFLNGKIL